MSWRSCPVLPADARRPQCAAGQRAGPQSVKTSNTASWHISSTQRCRGFGVMMFRLCEIAVVVEDGC